MANANPTIEDVADLAGVSKSTVSAVINNKDIVKDTTRRHVREAIRELNYRPRGAARRNFQSPKGKSIGFLIKEADNPYYAEALKGIKDVAHDHGFIVYSSSSGGDYDAEREIVEQFAAKDFDGLIITPILDDNADLSHVFELKQRNIPFVLLEKVPGIRANLVDTDNVGASCLAVKFLIDHGHTQIVHFAGPKYSQNSQERVEGVRRAFSESSLVFTPNVIIHTGDSLDDGYSVALSYFRNAGEDAPSAVTCYNDLVALGVLKALRELNIRVPEDVSVIGFDDLKILEYLPLPLTTVHVPVYEMGRKAAELLIQQIEAGDVSEVESVSLEARLVVRDTTSARIPSNEHSK